jgi:DNA mismatch repair protein MutS2
MDIEAIPGVGEKTASALAELDDPERALAAGDVAAIARAPGISDGRAARIVRAAIRQRHDDPGGFGATARAQEIYRDALDLLKERTVTAYGAHRLETFYPSPSASRIDEVREFTRQAMGRDPGDAVRQALAGVEPLSSPSSVRVRDRCLATTDAEVYARAQDEIPEVSVEIVEDARELAELARGYATVIALDEAFAGVDVEGDVTVDPDALSAPERVVPERTLAFFAENRQSIGAAIEVNRVADVEPTCDLHALSDALARLDKDGTVAGDDELDRLSTAVDELDATIGAAESLANDRLRAAIEKRDITIEGADLLSLVEQGAGVDSLLQRELADEYADAVAAARDHLVDALALEDCETTARRVFPDDPTYPVERDEEVAGRLRETLRVERDRLATRLKRDLARDLADAREDARELVAGALELDVELAIARFARDFNCTMPEFGGSGLTIEGGRSPLLDVPFAEVDSVDYQADGVVLLTGVNSGGKTSVLDLVALVETLGHMGLPVPADRARIERIDALHYHAKTQGTLDAGAFESTIREFGSLVERIGEGQNAMVLVDELESITEPGASANIMAGILEALDDAGATAVFVSHLARDIRAAAAADIAVDGIEAEGLVDGELRVDRSPVKGNLARSTPELIVEKLADERDGFYTDLLGKFD